LKDDRQCDRKDVQKSGEDHGFKIVALFSDTMDANWVLCTPVILVSFIRDGPCPNVQNSSKIKRLLHTLDLRICSMNEHFLIFFSM
jgi:hypothetical protein